MVAQRSGENCSKVWTGDLWTTIPLGPASFEEHDELDATEYSLSEPEAYEEWLAPLMKENWSDTLKFYITLS